MKYPSAHTHKSFIIPRNVRVVEILIDGKKMTRKMLFDEVGFQIDIFQSVPSNDNIIVIATTMVQLEHFSRFNSRREPFIYNVLRVAERERAEQKKIGSTKKTTHTKI